MTSEDNVLNGPNPQVPGRAGLYVDVENLHSDGQRIIQSLIDSWPGGVPAPSRLTLYVRADQVELWRLWATSRFTNLDVVVHGTQHFSMSSSKNSADIAIATNAMADLVLHRVTNVVVFSDDSDFISLYVSIRDEPGIPLTDGEVPFLWVVTDREGSLSATVKQFFPTDKLHIVETERDEDGKVASAESLQPATAQGPRPPSRHIWTDMAEAVLRDIPVGPFKSTECQPVIRRVWPDHPLAQAGGAEFGSQFKNNIWPVLRDLGVKIENSGRKPIKYDMTVEAKQASP